MGSYDQELDSVILDTIASGDIEPIRMLVDILCLAVHTGNNSLLEEYASHLPFVVLAQEGFPDWFLNALLAVMRKPEFMSLEGAWGLLRIFGECWHDLTEPQQGKVLAAFEALYPTLSSWKLCIGLTEILGFTLCDERAFLILCRLARVQAEIPRQYISHGLEHIASSCADKQVAKRAVDELLQMRTDPSLLVRTEAEESLARLTERGIFPGTVP